MRTVLNILLPAGMLAFHLSGQAQGKYFEVITEKSVVNGALLGKVQPLGGQFDIKLSYPGKHRQQLLEGVLQYLKKRPTLKIDTILNKGSVVVYRDFATICRKDTCFADLTALTYMTVVPEEGHLFIRVASNSKVFATIFDAKLRISPGGDVISEQDVPFNEFKYVQPADGRTQSSISPHGGLLGKATSRKIHYKLAYPDSIFDPEGKVVNARNKRIIEAFFDGYVADLDQFLQTVFVVK